MRRLSVLLMIGLAIVTAWLPALALQMQRPQAEYSADETIQTDEHTIQQKVFVTPTMERKELLTGAGDGTADATMTFRGKQAIEVPALASNCKITDLATTLKDEGNKNAQNSDLRRTMEAQMRSAQQDKAMINPIDAISTPSPTTLAITATSAAPNVN